MSVSLDTLMDRSDLEPMDPGARQRKAQGACLSATSAGGPAKVSVSLDTLMDRSDLEPMDPGARQRKAQGACSGRMDWSLSVWGKQLLTLLKNWKFRIYSAQS
ncbi:hypothetical protein [Alkalihalobacterium elongatum]|uniref:hypothetical protein n=1 Tax=Alkalihalobacterium elongatum TaxID=2675466 RepID=UPI001C1FAE99|nr:hypothetical protein [Alkalihalobacterium elongatum]